MGPNWKTTVCGIAVLLGAGCLAAQQAGGPTWLTFVGAGLAAIGSAAGHMLAADAKAPEVAK